MKDTCSYCSKTKEVARTDDGTKVCKKCLVEGCFTLIHTNDGKKILETALDRRVMRHMKYYKEWRTIARITDILRKWGDTDETKINQVVNRLYKQGQLQKQERYESSSGTNKCYYKFREEELERGEP